MTEKMNRCVVIDVSITDSISLLVLFPPELTVSCIGSTFTTSWQNNELNIEVYNKDTEDYTVSRTWTYGNGTQVSACNAHYRLAS